MLRKFLMAVSVMVPVTAHAAGQNAHDFKFTDIDENPLPLSTFAGKAVMVINTASKCGFTHQYEEIQALWDRYRDKGLVVLGVPSNDFGAQEPGTAEQIKQFCAVNFNVDFPLTKKTKVRGDRPHPFYAWAASELGALAKPRWNFHKYLIAPDGDLVDWFSTPTSPTSDKVIKAVERHLPKG
ncbi:glutathione peroxidase [Magnetovibrio sp. PR-2]|uniref:glutathione peroxidase n=1 Tax=Magnetovibrio sp. PR-2 TaxID=3120356 RepID=UPI002FCDEF64